ncbi:MAG TPA: division/cell wall cluster transcriptional repressor MraZ [Methyloprofundus sp.]|jgi:MraZ protein|uniref:division/cell wall cluster transcriptional repressor MraZ n=1 Tax=Methyloprofundus sp. TaxID=2020875 RepID=UPI00181FF75D|nr:division/cell wall cluster transcriptional repressor MraZ [Methyloprofundus sp.]MBT3812637.1 division/cell wall cluster transcriptional repressor MraZ [Gammaproteobacteria bacterium]HIL78287.1 transcriptional regulator MraZ [Methylococcales bacterium]MBT5221887.1 division/cell wall cluster transcriptional repressor MraZ [Gammaproteobacteria bacterium]MBT5824913.1 division/cell wall cluster transcriptional repressor MraZ [Gammaproteobacteria bacterium]MBT5967321.1 division/cell wall cluster 
MFRGVTAINLDAKGRFAIPTRFREELQDCCERQLVVTVAVNEKCIGEPGCLWLYPLPEWEKLELTVSKLPTLNKMAGKLRRFLIGNATETEMDAQGRLLLSEKLRKFAGMEKKLILVGQLNKFEIWNEDAWNAKENDWLEGDDDEGLDELENLSF